MVEQLRKPILQKSKSFSFRCNERSCNENDESNDLSIQCSPGKGRLNQFGFRARRRSSQGRSSHGVMNERPICENESTTRSPLKLLRALHSYDEVDETKRDFIATVREPVKRRMSFMPTTSHTRSILQTNETIFRSPKKSLEAACPVYESDDENNDNINVAPQELPRIRSRNSFIPASLRGVSLSPKPAFQKQTISSSQQRKCKPPLLRALSFTISTTTCNSEEADHSDHTRSTTSTPTSSSSDLHKQQHDEQSLESAAVDSTTSACGSFIETKNQVGDVDISTRSHSPSPNTCNTGVYLKETHDSNINVIQQMSLVIGTILWHHLKNLGSALNLKTIVVFIWMTLFDIVIEAFFITVELMSYALSITLRILETSMLWFVQQVHIRRLFIMLYDAFRIRNNSSIDIDKHDETTMNETVSSPVVENINRRPNRFQWTKKKPHSC